MRHECQNVFPGLGIAAQDLIIEALLIKDVCSFKFDVFFHQPLINFDHFPTKIKVDEQQNSK